MSGMPPQAGEASDVTPRSGTAPAPTRPVGRADVPFAEAPPVTSSTVRWLGLTIGVGVAIGIGVGLRALGILRDENCGAVSSPTRSR